MNIDQYENKIISYFEGELSTVESKMLLDEVESDTGAISRVFEEYQSLYQAMVSESKIEVPSERMQANFDNWLSEETAPKAKVVHLHLWKKLAGIAACFTVAMIGFQLYSNQESTSISYATLTEQAEQNYRQQSPTERIKAIRVGHRESSPESNNDIVNVLLKVLQVDQSSNVRLAAVETLSNYTDNENVRSGLISIITSETDAFVKIAILNALGRHNNEEVKRTLESITNDESQQKFIIDEAHLQLIKLDKIEL